MQIRSISIDFITVLNMYQWTNSIL